jgi:hypothetical protein
MFQQNFVGRSAVGFAAPARHGPKCAVREQHAELTASKKVLLKSIQ